MPFLLFSALKDWGDSKSDQFIICLWEWVRANEVFSSINAMNLIMQKTSFSEKAVLKK